MRPLVFTISCLILVVVAQDKYTDENRPYKFGFNIEGHQHRKEEKDEKGIIKGEYGFITADGYYRVTIYETDENNDFKIISMKNYYVGFPPGDPTTTEAPKLNKSPNRILQPLVRTEELTTTIAPQVKEVSTTRQSGKGGTCSGCFLPTTTKKPDQGIQNLRVQQTPNTVISKPNQNYPSPNKNTNNDLVNKQPNLVFGKLMNNAPKINLQPTLSKDVSKPPLQENEKIGIRNPLKSQTTLKNGEQANNDVNKNKLIIQSKPNISKKVSNANKNNIDVGPTIVGKEEQKISLEEMMALLYRFNYTVGFHGHHEDGYRNGDKTGDYFVNGRDGVSRKVTYIANEFGYQPNITLVQLKEGDENYPKEKSEKEYGLKGYEFKWFYRK